MSETRFSKRFATWADWLIYRATKPLTPASSKYYFRIRNYVKSYPGATLAEARGYKKKAPVLVFTKPVLILPGREPLEMSYRYTLGTNISDKSIPLSFTGYFFSDGELWYSDELYCYKIFAQWVKRQIGNRYRHQNYTIDDVLGEWGGVLREEHNAIVTHVKHGLAELEFRVKGVLRDQERTTWK